MRVEGTPTMWREKVATVNSSHDEELGDWSERKCNLNKWKEKEDENKIEEEQEEEVEE